MGTASHADDDVGSERGTVSRSERHGSKEGGLDSVVCRYGGDGEVGRCGGGLAHVIELTCSDVMYRIIGHTDI